MTTREPRVWEAVALECPRHDTAEAHRSGRLLHGYWSVREDAPLSCATPEAVAAVLRGGLFWQESAAQIIATAVEKYTTTSGR